MLKLSDYAKALAVASLISTTLAIAPVRANDGGLDNPPLVGAGIPTDASYTAPSCDEQRRDAWFARERARSDGDYSPEMPKVDCRTGTDVYAESTVDAD